MENRIARTLGVRHRGGARHLWLPALSAVTLGLTWATPAAAQDSPPADDKKPVQQPPAQQPPAKDSGALSEIVVTAQFREQALQTVPMSITAVNSDQIQQRSITNVVDVAQAAPNVTM